MPRSTRTLLSKITPLLLGSVGWLSIMANSASPWYENDILSESGDIAVTLGDETYGCATAVQLSAPAYRITWQRIPPLAEHQDDTSLFKTLMTATCNEESNCIESVWASQFNEPGVTCLINSNWGEIPVPAAPDDTDDDDSPVAACQVVDASLEEHTCDGNFHILIETIDGAQSTVMFSQIYRKPGYGCSALPTRRATRRSDGRP